MRVRGLSVGVFALVGAGRGGRSRAVLAVLCACVCAVCACLAVGVAPASAAGLEFGSKGDGAGQLERPKGVAVDQSTGDIYVADKGNDRIDQFEANGTFVRAWGWEVNKKSPKAELQECTT